MIKGTIRVSKPGTHNWKKEEVKWPLDMYKQVPNDIVEKTYSMLDGFDNDGGHDEVEPVPQEPILVGEPV